MKNTMYRIHWAGYDSYFVQEYTRKSGAEFFIGPIVIFGSSQECVSLLNEKRQAGYLIYGD